MVVRCEKNTPTTDACTVDRETLAVTMDANVNDVTDQVLDAIDAAIARFMGAELASADEVCDVLLDLRLLVAPAY